MRHVKQLLKSLTTVTGTAPTDDAVTALTQQTFGFPVICTTLVYDDKSVVVIIFASTPAQSCNT